MAAIHDEALVVSDRVRAANALRRITELLVVGESAGIDPDGLAAEADALEAIAARLAAGVTLAERPAVTAPPPGVRAGSSAVSGAANAIAPPLVNGPIQDGIHTGSVVFGAAYGGHPGTVHGGWVACVLDEFLARVLHDAGLQGMTGTLTIRYRRPTPLYREVAARAWLDRIDGRKVHARGELRDGETVCAEAEAIFIARR